MYVSLIECSILKQLRCCGVDNEGWGIYQESNWFYRQFSEFYLYLLY